MTNISENTELTIEDGEVPEPARDMVAQMSAGGQNLFWWQYLMGVSLILNGIPQEKVA